MQERGLRGLPRPPGLPDLPRQGKEGRRQQAEDAQEELLLQGKAQQAADAVHRRGGEELPHLAGAAVDRDGHGGGGGGHRLGGLQVARRHPDGEEEPQQGRGQEEGGRRAGEENHQLTGPGGSQNDGEGVLPQLMLDSDHKLEDKMMKKRKIFPLMTFTDRQKI